MPDEEEEELLEVEEKLGDYFSELEVTEEKLDDQMARQPGNYVYYARVAALCKRKRLMKEVVLKQYEARMRKEFRLGALSRGERYTNVTIEDDVRVTLEWKRLSESVIELRANEDVAASIAEGFFQRREMLREVGKIVAREAFGEVRVLKSEIERYKGMKRKVNAE